jgi:hypothetical protein
MSVIADYATMVISHNRLVGGKQGSPSCTALCAATPGSAQYRSCALPITRTIGLAAHIRISLLEPTCKLLRSVGEILMLQQTQVRGVQNLRLPVSSNPGRRSFAQ